MRAKYKPHLAGAPAGNYSRRMQKRLLLRLTLLALIYFGTASGADVFLSRNP